MSESKRQQICDLDAIAETAADLLANEGAALELDDIRMLADAIEDYGDRPDLRQTAAKVSMEDWLSYSFERTVDEANSAEELAEIGSELIKLAGSLNIALGVTRLGAIETKSMQLMKDEDSEDPEGYQTSEWKAPESDFSDGQVISLFSTILD